MAISNIMFHNNATAPSNGTELTVNPNGSMITVSIIGTATARTVHFEGATRVGTNPIVWTPIMMFNLGTAEFVSQTSSNNSVWQGSILGLTRFRCRLSAVSGGNVTVSGMVTS